MCLDGLLSDIVNHLPSKKYTILYTTTPREFEEGDAPVYEPTDDLYQDPVRADLKRDYSMHSRRDDTTKNSLFDEYQYFTPGSYMVVSFRLKYDILTSHRNLHGAYRRFRFHCYSVHWSERLDELAGLLCGL